MTLACGFANSFLTLFVARIGLGIGEAALAPAGFSLLADSFRPRRLVRATSIFSLGSLLGAGLAFFVGGALIEYLSQTPAPIAIGRFEPWQIARSEEPKSELQSLMRISYAVFCLKKNNKKHTTAQLNSA